MNKKIIYNYTIIFKFFLNIVVSSSVICAKEIPEWFLNSTLEGYTSSEYYIGVGSGKNTRKAQEEASSTIASQIQISISSTVNSSVEHVQENTNEYFKDIFTQNIQSTVDLSINGIEIIKNEKHKRTHYVLSVLNKQKYLDGLKTELDGINSSMMAYQSNGREAINKNEIFMAIQHYLDLQNLMPTFFLKKSFYNSISTITYTENENISYDSLVSEIGKIISRIKFSISSGNRQSALPGRPFPNPIIINAYYKYNTIPIGGMPLIVKYKNGDLISRGSTDLNGNYEIYASAVSYGNKKEKIIISPNFSTLHNIFKKYLDNIDIKVLYTVLDSPPISFTISINDNDGNPLKNIENKIFKNIQNLGHFVSDDSDLLLSGNVFQVSNKEIEGKNGIQYFVKTELDLILSLKIDNMKISSFKIVGKGLSNDSFQDAKIKSYQKFKIAKRDFSNILSNSNTKINKIFLERSTKNFELGKKLYSSKKYKEALNILSLVTHDEGQSKKAIKIINEIQNLFEEVENKKYEIKEKEKQKKREYDLSLARIAAENSFLNKNNQK